MDESANHGADRVRAWFRRWIAGDPRPAIGVVLGVVLGAVCVAIAFSAHASTPNLALMLCACAAVATSGMWPISSAIWLGGVLTLVWLIPGRSISVAAVSMFLMTAMLIWAGHRRAALPFTAWYLVCVIAATVPATSSPPEMLQGVVLWSLFALLFALIGELLFRQRQANVRLEEQRKAELQAQRRAIARELHDTAVYASTMIVMRAEAARLRGTTDPRLAEDLDFIARTGRVATADLRRMLDVLRVSDNIDLADGVTATERFTISDTSLAAALTEQIEKLRAAGITVNASIDGDVDSLPEIVSSTLARVATEACSNIVKYGSRDVPATIMVDVTEDGVDALFINGRNLPARAGGGQLANWFGESNSRPKLGLIGQRERIEAVGGTIDFSGTESRWLVRITIPIGR